MFPLGGLVSSELPKKPDSERFGQVMGQIPGPWKKKFLQRPLSYILDGGKFGLLNTCNFVNPNKCNFISLNFNKAVLMVTSEILVMRV